MPKRIQMTRQRPWRADNPDAVIVSRPSKWGNPFRVVKRPEGWIVVDENGVRYEPADYAPGNTRQFATHLAVHLFRRDAFEWLGGRVDVEQVRAELAGKDLACWCPLEDGEGNRVPCHADVLLEIANGEVQ